VNSHHDLPDALKELSKDLSIKAFLVQLNILTSKEKTERFIEKMLFCLKQPFSNAVVSLIRKHQEKADNCTPADLYLLWVIAKLAVDQYSIFAFVMDPKNENG